MKYDLLSFALRRRAPPAPQPVHETVRGVVFGHDVKTGAEVGIDWPAPGEPSILLMTGPAGSGKTTAFVDTVARLVARSSALPLSQRPCVTIPDPKSDIAALLPLAIAKEDPSRLRDLTILEPFSGVPLNFSQLKGVASKRLLATALTDVFSESTAGLGSGVPLGVQQRLALEVLLEACLDCDAAGASPLWALDAVLSEAARERLRELTNSQRARAWLGIKHSPEVLASLAARLNLVMTAVEAIERGFGCPDRCIDFRELLAPGKIVVWDVGSPPGGLQAITRAFSVMAFRLTVDAIMQRPSPYDDGHVALLAIDEVQTLSGVLAEQLVRLTTLGRSRRAAAWFATQGLGVINDASPLALKTLFSNVNRKWIGRMSPADAMVLAAEVDHIRPDETHAHARERLARTVMSLPPRTFLDMQPGSQRVVRALDVDVAGWKAAGAEHAAAIEAARQRWRVPADVRPVRLTDEQLSAPEPERPGGRRSRWG